MTTIKLRFRSSSVTGKEGTLYYQVTHFRKVAMLSAGYHIFPQEWDEVHSVIRITDDKANDRSRKALLRLYQSKADWTMNRMRKIADEKGKAGQYCTLEDLLVAFREIPPCASVFCYIHARIASKMKMECYGTARTYANALRSFKKFRGGDDLAFADLTGELMQEYEAWMLHAGLKRSSASCYMRTLRTLYRQAVEDGLVKEGDSFRKVHVSVGKTRKRAVTAGVMHSIFSLDLAGKPSLEFARDIFMFSFYTRGMSFVDIAHLKKNDLKNGLLTYNRRKTFQCLTIQWESPMQHIVNKYADQTVGSPYMFPILTGNSWDDHVAYGQTLQRINRSLKRIGALIGLSVPLTTYVARHKWEYYKNSAVCI